MNNVSQHEVANTGIALDIYVLKLIEIRNTYKKKSYRS